MSLEYIHRYPKKAVIKEDLLYYIWQIKAFPSTNLILTDGRPLQILDWGHRNENAGPDFSNGKIKIANQLWAGNIEMHVKSSDWLKHRHQSDQQYQSVILHVVYHHDQEIFQSNNIPIPCLEIQSLIPPALMAKYRSLMDSSHWVSCANQIGSVDRVIVVQAAQQAVYHRLQTKCKQIAGLIEATQNDWEEVFFKMLCRNFGFHKNNEAFELLANTISYRLIQKYRNRLLSIEALLFGQSGLLNATDCTDQYYLALQAEYQHLSSKYNLQSLAPGLWIFHRMRPANFPTIRLAQLAVLLFKTAHFFSKILAAQSVKELDQLFQTDINWYWKTHYRFGVSSAKREKKLGRNSIRLIIVNTIVPVLFYYGYVQQKSAYQDKALQFLESCPPEHNSIIKKWSVLGVRADNAMMSQGLLHLKRNYCDDKQCLRCPVGNHLLTSYH